MYNTLTISSVLLFLFEYGVASTHFFVPRNEQRSLNPLTIRSHSLLPQSHPVSCAINSSATSSFGKFCYRCNRPIQFAEIQNFSTLGLRIRGGTQLVNDESVIDDENHQDSRQEDTSKFVTIAKREPIEPKLSDPDSLKQGDQCGGDVDYVTSSNNDSEDEEIYATIGMLDLPLSADNDYSCSLLCYGHNEHPSNQSPPDESWSELWNLKKLSNHDDDEGDHDPHQTKHINTIAVAEMMGCLCHAIVLNLPLLLMESMELPLQNDNVAYLDDVLSCVAEGIVRNLKSNCVSGQNKLVIPIVISSEEALQNIGDKKYSGNYLDRNNVKEYIQSFFNVALQRLLKYHFGKNSTGKNDEFPEVYVVVSDSPYSTKETAFHLVKSFPVLYSPSSDVITRNGSGDVNGHSWWGDTGKESTVSKSFGIGPNLVPRSLFGVFATRMYKEMCHRRRRSSDNHHEASFAWEKTSDDSYDKRNVPSMPQAEEPCMDGIEHVVFGGDLQGAISASDVDLVSADNTLSDEDIINENDGLLTTSSLNKNNRRDSNSKETISLNNNDEVNDIPLPDEYRIGNDLLKSASTSRKDPMHGNKVPKTFAAQYDYLVSEDDMKEAVSSLDEDPVNENDVLEAMAPPNNSDQANENDATMPETEKWANKNDGIEVTSSLSRQMLSTNFRSKIEALTARALVDAQESLLELENKMDSLVLERDEEEGESNGPVPEFGRDADAILTKISESFRTAIDEAEYFADSDQEWAETQRKQILEQVAGTGLHRLFLLHLQNLRDHYGRLYECSLDNLLNIVSEKGGDEEGLSLNNEKWDSNRLSAARKAEEEFIKAAFGAIPQVCRYPDGELFEEMVGKYECSEALRGLLGDMLEATSARKLEDEWNDTSEVIVKDTASQEQDENDDMGVSLKRRVGLRQMIKNIRNKRRERGPSKWYERLAWKVLVIGVNYIQGWLILQALRREARRRDRAMPKFPLF